MGNRINVLAQHLTGKENLEECSVDEVKHIAQHYPYYAPAQFLLLQKLRQSGLTDEADAQYKKAVLFYPDPLQFDFFLSSEKFYEEKTNEDGFETAFTENVEENKEDIEGLNVEQTAYETQESEPFVSAEELSTPSHFQPEATSEELPLNENDADAITGLQTDVSQEADIDKTAFIGNANETTPVSPAEITNTKEPVQTNAALAFEPYHTVDYFASQGIKISQDELPKDKLGKQLKSFTEWLKTMKRLPASQPEANTESAAEKGVETLAVLSVTDSEVVTEAMAEVWAKQGAREKALDIYNKLLLHNPSKKAYFAAKIENLKQS